MSSLAHCVRRPRHHIIIRAQSSSIDRRRFTTALNVGGGVGGSNLRLSSGIGDPRRHRLQCQLHSISRPHNGAVCR